MIRYIFFNFVGNEDINCNCANSYNSEKNPIPFRMKITFCSLEETFSCNIHVKINNILYTRLFVINMNITLKYDVECKTVFGHHLKKAVGVLF